MLQHQPGHKEGLRVMGSFVWSHEWLCTRHPDSQEQSSADKITKRKNQHPVQVKFHERHHANSEIAPSSSKMQAQANSKQMEGEATSVQRKGSYLHILLSQHPAFWEKQAYLHLDNELPLSTITTLLHRMDTTPFIVQHP
jgi:hypothetical protein